MSIVAQMLAEANEVAAYSADMNEAQKGGGGNRLLPEGYCLARMVEYIEFGNQPQEFGGKAKEPALEFQIAFALFGEGYQNEDGTPYIVRPYSLAYSRNEKAGAFLAFKALNWRNQFTHFAQLLNQEILVHIKHVAKSKTDPTIVSRIDMKGFLPPLDPLTKAPYAVPAVPDNLFRLFLWDRPSKAAWDALFIEGTFDDGRSKNMLQEKCLTALNFTGSPLEQLLVGAGDLALPSAPAQVPAAVPAAVANPAAVPATPEAAVPFVPAAAVPSVAPATPAVPIPVPVPVAPPAGPAN